MKVLHDNDLGPAERTILVALAFSPTVLGRVAAQWDGKLFTAPWSNLVAGWCLKHYEKHNQAPGRSLAHYFERWAESGKDEDTVKLVQRFLDSLEREAQRTDDINVEHVLDLAGRHFNLTRCRTTVRQLQQAVDARDVEAAEELFVKHRRVELGVGAGVNLFNDPEAIKATLRKERRLALVEYPGALGQFFGSRFERDGFVAFMAPDKTGKSFWLMDVAWNAVCQRKRTAYFSIGDDSQEQIQERFLVRVAHHPFRSETGWPLTVRWPTRLYPPGAPGDCARCDYETETFAKPLTARKAWEASQKLTEQVLKSDDSYLRVSAHPMLSINVLGLKSVLQAWERDGFVPDVCVIDYADNLEAPPGKLERRDQIGVTWQLLRALSQEGHCLVVTATQSDANAYEKKTLDRRNFSEDKRKLAHVTGMIGINVHGDEKERQLMRLNWIVKRQGEYTTSRCVHVAGCLALGCPAVLATF